MTPIRQFWNLFCVHGLQLGDERLATRLWFALLDTPVPDKQSKLFAISRVVDAAPRHEPEAIRHFYRAFSPQVLVTLSETAVELRRLKRHEGNFIQEKVLNQTRHDGSWAVLEPKEML